MKTMCQMERVEELEREVLALRERLSRLSEASMRISESLDFQAVLQGVLDSARSLTGARYGVIYLEDHSGQVEDFLYSWRSPEDTALLVDLPEGQTIATYLHMLEEPLRVRDFQNFAIAQGLPAFLPPFPTGSTIPFLAAPTRHFGERVGAIFVGDTHTGEEFTPEDEETLVTFASQAALAIANARRHREEQRARVDLETLVNTAPVGMLVFDGLTGVPVLTNREMRRILGGLHGPGGTAKQVLDTLTLRRADGSEVSLQELPQTELFASGETVRAEETVLEAPDGRSVATLLNATTIRSNESEVESVVVTLQDMTPLEELERLRAEFLAMVSHELRGPLTSIKGSTTTVMGGSTTFGTPEMMQFFRIIDRQADQMSSLIDDLMDVARIETGTLSVNPEPVQMAALLDQARSTFKSGGGRHEIRTYYPPDLPKVMADSRRIVQVLGNLLSNAAGHSPWESIISVRVDLHDYHLELSVEDQGRGLPAEEMSLLFRKFSGLGLGGRGGDTGLGLSICKGIVEAHGGSIWAESNGLGHGSKFAFSVPIVEEADAGTVTVPVSC